MTTSSSAHLLAFLLISTAANFAVKAHSDAHACVSNLVPCTSFTGSSSKPPQTCCGPLKTVITTQLDCLCKLYNTPGLLQSLKVNLTQALNMAVRCGLDGVNLISECSSSKASSSSGRSLKLKLVHIDSPASGHRTIYDSLHHRDQVGAERARARFVQIYHEAMSAKENDYRSIYYSDIKVDPTGLFLASFGVGTPATPQLLALDTGSTLTWVTCVGSPFQAGNYNFRESRTCKVVGCRDPECQIFQERQCSDKVYVKLKSITVGDVSLAINPILFDKDISNGGTIMDSGSAITYLADDAFTALWDKLRDKMHPADYRFCFEDLQPEYVPEVQFIFEGDVKLVVGMDGLFGPAGDTVQCFNRIKAAYMSDLTHAMNLTVIGMNAQQHQSIGFDYSARRMYVSQISCAMF